ncbi:MAG: hypothetical protein Q8920_04865, partial [Bacillota bacterium]|nr:hypothetical protein [Bacillota bacterium]
PYLLGKFLQGVLSAVFTFLWIKSAGLSSSTKPAFIPVESGSQLNWQNCISYSIQSFFQTLLLILICTVVTIIFSVILKNRRKQLF